MLKLLGHDRPAHDACAVASLKQAEILLLPSEEREKITLCAAGVDLMRRLMDRST